MAMLAEPRRKVKWTLNPRGKLWSEDSNKFGQKMLEKMGWTAGKGLGANEQGITSHIHVELKCDNAGVGFKGKDTEWCKHQSHFDDVLKNLYTELNGVNGHVLLKSLEDRSKASKARLHYQKFTRGKDVSKYSNKDLGCILGIQGEKSMVNCNGNSCKVEDIGAEDDSFGVKTIVGGSVDDYLNQRRSSKWNAKPAEREGVQEENGKVNKRKVDQDLECEEDLKVNFLEHEETRGTDGEEVVSQVRKKRKKLNCNKEEEEKSEVSLLPANTDDSRVVDGNNSLCGFQIVKNGSPTCNGFDTDHHPEPVVKNGRSGRLSSKEMLVIEVKERLSLEGVVDEVKPRKSILKNDSADKATGRKDHGAQKRNNHAKCERSQLVECPVVGGGCNDSGSICPKKSKKGKSASVLEKEKSDYGLSTNENSTVEDRNHSLISSAEDQVVVDDKVCSRNGDISRKVKGRIKKKNSKESKMKPDICFYSCINRKEHDNTALSESCKLFPGGNLAGIKGYGNLEILSREEVYHESVEIAKPIP